MASLRLATSFQCSQGGAPAELKQRSCKWNEKQGLYWYVNFGSLCTDKRGRQQEFCFLLNEVQRTTPEKDAWESLACFVEEYQGEHLPGVLRLRSESGETGYQVTLRTIGSLPAYLYKNHAVQKLEDLVTFNLNPGELLLTCDSYTAAALSWEKMESCIRRSSLHGTGVYYQRLLEMSFQAHGNTSERLPLISLATWHCQHALPTFG